MSYQDYDLSFEDTQDTFRFLESLAQFQATNQITSLKGQYIG